MMNDLHIDDGEVYIADHTVKREVSWDVFWINLAWCEWKTEGVPDRFYFADDCVIETGWNKQTGG